MLHDILLSLSGYRSEIWEQVRNRDERNESLQDFTSPPEKAMLEVLEQLSRLHLQIKEEATRITSSHSSVICRAVAASILDQHLAAFRKKVLQVESSILRQDAGYVGGYRIVPLSTIVAEFAPWTRRLQWLKSVITFVEDRHDTNSCTGKALLDFLSKQVRTGYTDVEEMATSLLVCGQRVWMRSAASWILYGKLPAFGASDFLIQKNDEATDVLGEYTVNDKLRPNFVSFDTAQAMLAIGNAINQTQQGHHIGSVSGSHEVQALDLVSRHVRAMESLNYPLTASALQRVMTEIDESISQNALSQLLPFEKIAIILRVIHRFVLLTNGEFATSLIEHAESKVANRKHPQDATRPVRKLGRVDDLTVQAAELSSILNGVWDALASVQNDSVLDEESFDAARKTIFLRVKPERDDGMAPLAAILPGGAVLDLDLTSDPTMKLFLHTRDLSMYSSINAYLLAIRRAELRLSNLWKLTGHRRWHPQPLGPPMSSTKGGQALLATRRARELSRGNLMRQHWVTASKALFIISELDSYFHSEIIGNSWFRFETWISEGSARARPGSSRSNGSRPGTASSTKSTLRSTAAQDRSRNMNDPRKLAKAHRAYLEALHSGLLLGSHAFAEALKVVINMVDHYVALFSRLQMIWEGLDLQEDDGVVDAFSNYVEDEKAVIEEMRRSRGLLEESVDGLKTKLEEAERNRLLNDMNEAMTLADSDARHFVPWKPRTMDRLMMKLDFLTCQREGHTEHVVGQQDDDDHDDDD